MAQHDPDEIERKIVTECKLAPQKSLLILQLLVVQSLQTINRQEERQRHFFCGGISVQVTAVLPLTRILSGIKCFTASSSIDFKLVAFVKSRYVRRRTAWKS
jgi:hypothetical protein